MSHSPCEFFAEIGGLMDRLFRRERLMRNDSMTREEISLLQDELYMLCEKEKAALQGRTN